MRTETLDISNNGFYCITPHPFAPGERLTCLIGMHVRPTAASDRKDLLYLQAEVDIVRIVITNGDGFGVGCRISDFRVLTNDAIPSWALMQEEPAAPGTPIEQLV